MPNCSTCGRTLSRTHRTSIERVFCVAAYRCRVCKRRVRVPHPGLKANLDYLLSKYTHCIRCGNARVRLRRGGPDHIDSISTHPLSHLARVTGAPVYHCLECRTQYYDWRRPEPPAKRPKSRQLKDRLGSSGGPQIVGLS